MATDQDERPRFFEDQYLGADDLNLAVDYSRVQDGRHALGGHTWGIALGLEVREQTRANGEIDVYISPGYAWDGFGRPIIVLEPVPISVGLLQGIAFQQGVDDRTPEGRPLAIWLRYQEQVGRGSLPGFEACTDEGKSRRIRETFAVEVSAFQPPSPPPLEGAKDNIVVNGTSIAAKDALTIPPTSNPFAPIAEIPDGSIPFQEFPSSDEPKRWLVPVGLLRWKPPTAGQAGKFIMRNPADIAENRRSRRYIGVVAESIQAADGHLRIKPRSSQNSSLWTDDLLWVEGKLRIEGDARLLEGALHFRNRVDDPQKSSAVIKRVETSSGTALQAGIEKDRQGLNVNRVAIGTSNGSAVEEHVVILDDGKVGMGTPTPTGRLTVKGTKVPQGLLTIFSDGADIEYDGGSDKLFVFKHTDSAGKTAFMGGNVGIGTTTPGKPLVIQAARQGEELIGFEDPGGHLKWHINQNLGGANPGLNFAETGVADGRLFIQAGSGNLGIGTVNPVARLTVESQKHINVLLDWTASQRHMTLTVGGIGTGLHFSDNNRFFISADPYANKNVTVVGNEVLTILGSGNVGIGNAAPTKKLDVIGSGKFSTKLGTLGYDPDSGYPVGWTGGVHTFDVYAEGAVGVGIAGNIACLLHSSGDLTITGTARKPGGGSWTDPSDQQLKKNIRSIDHALEKLLGLRGVTFEWKEPVKHGNFAGQQIGLVAQEVEKVFPEWVGTGPDGFKEITVRGFEALTIEALRELKKEIDRLANRKR